MTANTQQAIKRQLLDFERTGELTMNQNDLAITIEYYHLIIDHSYIVPHFELLRGQLLRDLRRLESIYEARSKRGKPNE